MTLLLADPRVAAVPVVEDHSPLVTLGPALGPARARVRAGLAQRLDAARRLLPAGVALRVVEGHRSPGDQQAIVRRYAAQLAAALHGPVDA